MDPVVVSVVSALSAGALAVGKEFATSAIKDSYKALKDFVVSRFSKAAPFVDAVEQEPESTPEQQVLAKQLTGLAEFEEVKKLVTDLAAALQNEPRAAAVLDFDKLRVLGTFEMTDIEASSTLLRAKDAVFQDFKMTGFRPSGSTNDDKKKA